MKKTNFKKILFIRVGAIGDVIHTLNAPRAIKELYPEVNIHYLSSMPDEFMNYMPFIDKHIHYGNIQLTSIFSKDFKDFANTLKKEKYDVVINLQPSIKTRLLARLAGIKNVYNYHKRNSRHAVIDHWLTAKRAFPEITLPEDLDFRLSPELTAIIKDKVKNFNSPYIVFNSGHVFAKRQGRTYPIEKWVELGNKIQEKYNGTIIITGVKADAEVLRPLEKIKNSVSFVDKLTLEENSALLGCANLVISGDSGPLHIASALGVKVLGLFGSMPITRTGPYGKNCHTITSPKNCAPCNRRKCKYLRKSKELYAPCMKEIEVDKIFEKVCEILN